MSTAGPQNFFPTLKEKKSEQQQTTLLRDQISIWGPAAAAAGFQHVLKGFLYIPRILFRAEPFVQLSPPPLFPHSLSRENLQKVFDTLQQHLPVGENPSAPSCCCCCHSSFSTIDGQLVFGNLFFSLSTPLHNWFHFITERFAMVLPWRQRGTHITLKKMGKSKSFFFPSGMVYIYPYLYCVYKYPFHTHTHTQTHAELFIIYFSSFRVSNGNRWCQLQLGRVCVCVCVSYTDTSVHPRVCVSKWKWSIDWTPARPHTRTHNTKREKKGWKNLLLHASWTEMYTQERSSWWWRAFSSSYFYPCAFDLSSMDGKKEIFIENRYSIQIRAGCNILPGAAPAPETILLSPVKRKKMMARFCLPPCYSCCVCDWILILGRKGATFGFVEE